ncbi:unnamed protein product [Thelazia callipaeda]|uniref:Peptidase S1 domain-containing protein n=1 Tax=Thelazia callipaeda TaxID=103827 RepID=A0A0N5CXF6_THECL|nr:unnamed protein product [Thelazia callipaeda]
MAFSWILCLLAVYLIESKKILQKLSKEEINTLLDRCRTNIFEERERFVRSTTKYERNVPSITLMGGENVKQNEAPFSIYLHYSKYDVTANCAGTLITDRHILTAAHCFILKNCETGSVLTFLSSEYWKVFYGGGCLPIAKATCAKFQKMARAVHVKSISIPQEYLSSPCFHNDIAIVTVNYKMILLQDAACVAKPLEQLPNQFVLYSRGSNPKIMEKITSLMTINVSRIDCEKDELSSDVKADQICTSEMSEMNMCAGDSGSGLMFKNSNKTWTVAGVASAGTDCNIIDITMQQRKGSQKLREP